VPNVSHSAERWAALDVSKSRESSRTTAPAASLRAQQRRFNTFRTEFKTERPHAALGGATPKSVYHPSPRPYPTRLPPIEYPGHYLVKRITTGGTFKFGRRLLFVATPLIGYDVGLEEVDDGIWSFYLCDVLIARFDERKYILRS